MDYADYDIAPTETSAVDTSAYGLASVPRTPAPAGRQAAVVVVEDGVWISQELWAICEFLDIAVLRVSGHSDISAVLRRRSPMAVVCELDGAGQDGCHIMKTVAGHDPSLPILIVTGDDPALIGAADAVEEIWRLTEVNKTERLPGIAGLVDFLFQAGRKGGCLRLMPVRS